ncbi:MAG: PAS domain-containing protein, partial [Anaerolineae bacterium]|nr:PAS domain-containing protein [Anaerolineae bacterium]
TAVVNARLFQAVEDERGRLQAVIESSRDGIIFVGLDMRILVMNSQALHFLKLVGTPDDWVNLSMSCLVTQLRDEFPDVARLIVRELRKASKDQSASRRGEFVIGNRALQWLHLPVVVSSAALGRLIVYRDVTEERLLERMREDLTHSMVHDLRNPLTGIYGAIKLLDRVLTADVLSPSHRQIFDLMQSSTERMLSMVNAILDISKLESGQMPIVQKAVALPDLAQKVLDLQLSLAADKDLHLELEVDPDLPPVWVDLELVQRVLQNLVGNAIKFTPENGVVRINAHKDLDNPGKIRVQVIDTGEGVPSEIQGRLFQKFVAGQQIGRGSGLGLAFCRMVLEAHKERIWLEDTSEAGTSFCFTLPIVSEGNASEMGSLV